MDLKLIDKKDIKELNRKLNEIKKENAELLDVWMTTEEACEYLKVGKKSLKRYRDTGKLAYSKDGKYIHYKKSDLIKYLNNHYFSTENIKNK